ncbi:hypothetical protein D3C79_1011430 [compost metagenome]
MDAPVTIAAFPEMVIIGAWIFLSVFIVNVIVSPTLAFVGSRLFDLIFTSTAFGRALSITNVMVAVLPALSVTTNV